MIRVEIELSVPTGGVECTLGEVAELIASTALEKIHAGGGVIHRFTVEEADA